MANRKQLNVQISEDLKQKAQVCAALRKVTLSQFVTRAIETQVAEEYKTVSALKQAVLDNPALLQLIKTSFRSAGEECPEGKVVTEDQMRAMIKIVAQEDWGEGFEVEHFTDALPI